MKAAILVLGATGPVGRGVVQACLSAGRPVVAVARDPAALQELQRQNPAAPLQTLLASVGDEASAAALVSALRAMDRPFLGVVAALGGVHERGRLVDVPADRLRVSFETAVLPHLVAARHLLPWLEASGRNCGYVVIGGPGARHPWAGYGHRSVAAAALAMLVRALHAEAVAFAVRLQLLEVDSPLRTEQNRRHARGQWPCAHDIGRQALALLEHRNEARCTDAVVAYRNGGCMCDGAAPDPAGFASSGVDRVAIPGPDVESAPAGSSNRKAADAAPRPYATRAEGQEPDSPRCEATARFLRDVRALLEPFTPHQKNQERSP